MGQTQLVPPHCSVRSPPVLQQMLNKIRCRRKGEASWAKQNTHKPTAPSSGQGAAAGDDVLGPAGDRVSMGFRYFHCTPQQESLQDRAQSSPDVQHEINVTFHAVGSSISNNASCCFTKLKEVKPGLPLDLITAIMYHREMFCMIRRSLVVLFFFFLSQRK